MYKDNKLIAWRCLVIGYGSIGKRHADILKNLGCEVFLVTQQQVLDYICYLSIEQALEEQTINYVVIANPTHLHYKALVTLINLDYQGIVLVEKPLFSNYENLSINNIKKILVAYNLRFCDLLIHAKQLLRNEELISFSAYVGQYLPTWRKNSNYRDSYSAKKIQGGGVLRDLSHELDYSIWFCGQSIEVASIGGHYSELEIDSEDAYSILMRCSHCPIVNVQVNYLDRFAKRDILIHTKNKTIHIDLLNGILTVDGKLQLQSKEVVMQTYVKQHKAVLAHDYEHFCSLEEGLNLMKLIERIEQANFTQQWMKSV